MVDLRFLYSRSAVGRAIASLPWSYTGHYVVLTGIDGRGRVSRVRRSPFFSTPARSDGRRSGSTPVRPERASRLSRSPDVGGGTPLSSSGRLISTSDVDAPRYKDPASAAGDASIAVADLHRARTAHGTDEDLILVAADSLGEAAG